MKRAFLLLIAWLTILALWYEVHYPSVIGIPTITSANTNVTSLMIAAHAAGFVVR